ncbi:MAG: MATE family efflux transporter [Lachnospiraceae bacterium]|nr:MATE family efflux transporter [Lachnospiraceae bacterium]
MKAYSVKMYSEKEEQRTYLFSNQDLKRLIVPLIIEQILAVSVGMADTMMVSSVGEAATSGVSLVDMINNLLISVFAAVSTGGAVVASQYLGKRDRKKACESANQLLLITGLIAAAVMAVSILFRKGLLNVIYYGTPQDVMQNAQVYLLISALSYPFLAVYNSCAALFRSMGNSRVSMQVSILMNIINIIGNACFLFLFHWGVAGAAAASLLARMTACVILMLRLRNPALEIHTETGTGIRWNGAMIRNILHIGLPGGVESSIFQLGRVLVVSMIATFGTVQIAANAVANNLDGMGVLPGQAMNLAVITVIGQCVGAGDYEQAEYYTKKLMKFTYLINGLCCAAVILTMPLTMRLYGLSAETLRLAAVLVLIHDGCAILLWPASFTLTNVLRAANDVRFPMVVSILSMIVCRLGLSFVIGVGLGWGAIGVWAAMVVDWIARTCFFAIRYRSGKWKTFYAV